MASKFSPATPRSKLPRGSGTDSEKISPATKTGASMLGDNSPKATRSPRSFSTEKKTPVSRGAELHQVQEDLAKTKEQLSLMEKSKSNLLQDLARSKRQLEDLTSKLQDANEVSKKDRLRAEEMEHASFTAAEDWQAELEIMKKQYEAAVMDLQTAKQEMEGLKHELIVCVEAKDEAVRLAGEAMNAAESTAKRVEEMSAELLAAKGSVTVADTVSPSVDELMAELSCTKESLAKANTAFDKSTKEAAALLAAKEAELGMAAQEASILRSDSERLRKELALVQRSVIEQTGGNDELRPYEAQLAAAKEAEKKSELQLLNLMSQLDQARTEVEHAKASETKSTVQLANLNSELEQLRTDLATAREATTAAVVAENAANAQITELNADIAKVRDSELLASVSLADTASKLEEAQENLAKAVLERTTLADFLGSLKADLERSQAQLQIVEEKAEHARMKAESLSIELIKLTEANKEELTLLNEQVASAHSDLESLKLHAERQRLEMVDMAKRESLASNNVTAVTKCLEDAKKDLAELKQQEFTASEKGVALAKQLDINMKEVSEMKERELNMTSKAALLMQQLEDKQAEVIELNNRVCTANSTAAALTTDLERTKAELWEIKEREASSAAKATALSVVLASQMETSQAQLHELKEKEGLVSAKVTSLMAELNKTKLNLEEALTLAKVARDDADKLQVSLQVATVEVEHAKQDKQKVIGEATRNREEAAAALAMFKAAKDEAERALQATHVAELEVEEHSQRLRTLKEDLKLSQEEGLMAKRDVESLRNELQVAMVDLQALEKELEQLRLEAQSSREEAGVLRNSIVMERERAVSAEDEAQAAKREVEKTKEELHKIKLDEEEARSASQAAERKLQEALLELQVLQLDAAHAQEEFPQRQSPVEKDSSCPISQDELETLKTKLHDAEEQLALSMKEEENSQANAQELQKNLEGMKVEKEANEKAFLEVLQHLADTEKAKSNMEAEIQRLLDDSKQWHAAKDAIDIPVHSEVIGRSFPSECRDEKPQPDSPDEALNLATASVIRDANDHEEAVVESQEIVIKDHMALRENFASLSLKREELLEKEDGHAKDEVAPYEELASLPTKKKKKTLLVRLGTLLEKKKHAPQQPTP